MWTNECRQFNCGHINVVGGVIHYENMGHQITEGHRNGTLSYILFKRLFLQTFHTKLCVTMVSSMTRILNSLTLMVLQTRNMLFKFRVCRSVHLHTFKWINQLDAAINYRFIVCSLDTAQHVSDILMPIIRSLSTAATGLTMANSTATTMFLW
jgi:hypothetical protein